MKQKIIQWWINRRQKHINSSEIPQFYTRQQLENAYKLGYTDGRRDGLTVAREQATKSLKEILWQQNKTRGQK